MNTIVAAILVAILIAIAGFGVGYRKGSESTQTKADAAMAKHLKEDADAASRAAQDAADTSTDLTEAINKSATAAYEKGVRDAEAKGAAVTADLRNGNLRLRDRWAACETQRLSDATASAAQPVDPARDGEESAGRIVRAAAQCDAQVAGLISAYDSAKKLIDDFNIRQRDDSSRR